MPGAPVSAGSGTEVTFETSGFSARITNVRWSGIMRNAIDTSYMQFGTIGANQFGNREYIPSGLIDPGEIVLDIHFNPEDHVPMNEPEMITVTWPKAAADATAATWACTGFVRQMEINDPMDEKMTATLTIKLTGSCTMTDAT